MNCNPTIPVQNVEGKTVYMGVFTTFNARSVTFDFSAWVDSLGDGTFSVSLLRPGDTTPYAVAGLSIDGTLATWTFDATDTAIAGYGRAFLSYVTADAMDMTVDFDVYIAQNSAPSGDTPPDPLDTWYQQMLEAAARAQTAAQSAEASASAAAESESIVEGYKNAAETAAQNAEASASAAEESESTVEGYKVAAETAARNAAASQALADQYAAAAALAQQAAETAATAAESWAIGGTGTRTGEDADNAQHYAEQADNANTDVQAARTDIQDSIDGVAQEDTAQEILALVEQIAESGGGASDLNGFGLTLDQSDNSVNLTYTNPTTGEEYDPAKLPTDTTAMQIAAALQALNAAT